MKTFEYISCAMIAAGLVLTFGAAGRADCYGLDGAVIVCALVGMALMCAPVIAAGIIVEWRLKRVQRNRKEDKP